jgi:DNA-binding GntR family transcriptional regulator
MVQIHDLKIVDGPTLVRDHTLEKLRGAIMTGLYPPGMRLIERELCEALGVSRTSVREALRQLQSESLVEISRRRSVHVAVITAKDANDIYLLRERLETLAIRRFVEGGNDKPIKSLQRVHRDMRRALDKQDLRQLAVMAGEFYEIIIAGADSRVIFEMARQLLARVTYLRFRSMSEPGRLEAGMVEWDAIMDAISARDPDAAERAMAIHLRNAREAVVGRLLREQDADDQANERRAG